MPRHFTKQQIDEIRSQLATYGVRDSELPETINVTDEDFIAIVQEQTNKRLSIETLGEHIRLTFVNDHNTAVADHETAVEDHNQAGRDHTASESATERANAAAAAAEHMVDIHEGPQGPQGPQGNTGSSVDYPYELVNNLTTDDSTKGLSAAQGKVLDGKISQLGQKVDDLSTGKYYGYFASASELPDDVDVDGFSYVGGGPTYTVYNLRSGVWASSGITVNQSPIGNEDDIDQDSNGKLQFANRAYNSQTPNGLGFKILRKNATFASQVTEANTVYEIRYNFDLGGEDVQLPLGAVLHFVGGVLSNGKIIGNKSGIQVEDDRHIFSRTLELGGSWSNQTFFLSWWELYADGIHDDRDVVSAIAAAVSNNGKGKIVFPFAKEIAVAFKYDRTSGYPLSQDKIMHFISADFEIDFNQSIVKILPNSYHGSNFIHAQDCRFALHNGKIVGDRILHNYDGISAESNWMVWQFGGEMVAYDLEISQFTGNAFYVSNYFVLGDYDNILSYAVTTIHDCKMHHIGRGAIGYTGGKSIHVFNCDISYIGDSNGISGFAPRVGIGFEFEWTKYAGGAMCVEDCTFENCDGGSIAWSDSSNLDWDSVTIRRCKLGNPVQLRMIASNSKPYIFDGCELSGSYNMENRTYSLPTRVTNTKILGLRGPVFFYDERADFENVVIEGEKDITDEHTGYLVVPKGAVFKNCKIKSLYGDNANTTLVTGYPYTGGVYLFSTSVTISELVFDNCEIKDTFIRTSGGGNSASDYPCIFRGCVLEDAVIAQDDRLAYFDSCQIKRIAGASSSPVYFNNCRIQGKLKDFKHFGGTNSDRFLNLSGFKKYIKNSVFDAEMAFWAGYEATPDIYAENSQMKVVRMSGTHAPGNSRLFFKNCQIRTHFTAAQVTMENSTLSQFVNIFYGAAASLTINQANVVALGNSAFWASLGNVTANAGADQYIFVAIPDSFGAVKCVAHPLTLAGTFAFVDEFGAEKYNVYKTTEASLGSVTLTIEAATN